MEITLNIETQNKINTSIDNFENTTVIYDASLNDMTQKIFNIFKASFSSFHLNPEESLNINNILVATLFVAKDDDFVRIFTSLKKDDGSRAIGTLLGKASPAYEPIMKKQNYVGYARLFGNDYITVYSPILENDKIIGILFVGYYYTPDL